MEELNLKEICNIFLRRKVGIIIILLFSIAMGIVYSFVYVKPVYTSYASLLLVPEDSKESDDDKKKNIEYFELNSELVDTYGELIKKTDNLKEVLDGLEIKDLKPQSLKNNIEVTTITDTGVIKIKVTNSNPEYAAKIANKIVEIFDEKIADTYIPNSVSIVDKAEISTEPSNVNHKKDIIVFTFIGIVIACGYVVIRYMWDN